MMHYFQWFLRPPNAINALDVELWIFKGSVMENSLSMAVDRDLGRFVCSFHT